MNGHPGEKVGVVMATWEGVKTKAFRAHVHLLSTMSVRLPPGCLLFDVSHRQPTAAACEELFKGMMDRQVDWILYIDDDVICPADAYFRLRKHANPAERPILSALGYWRGKPHWPSLFKFEGWRHKDGAVIPSVARPLPVCHYEPDSLIRVDGTGFPCILIHSSVLKRIAKPWFMAQSTGTPDGVFMHRVCRAGIPVFCHTGTQVEHLSETVVNEQTWKAWCRENGGEEAAHRLAIEHFRLQGLRIPDGFTLRDHDAVLPSGPPGSQVVGEGIEDFMARSSAGADLERRVG